MVTVLHTSAPSFSIPHIDQVDDLEDTPEPGQPLVSSLDAFYARACLNVLKGLLGSLQLPQIVFGAASFSNQYNSDDHLKSSLPFRSIRLALRHVFLLA